MMYSTKNIEAVRDQMQQFDDIFKVMLDVQKEYNSLSPAEEQERDDDDDHNICIFKQKIHCWIKDAELKRKENLSSRRSHDFSFPFSSNLVEAVNLLAKNKPLLRRLKWQN